MEKPFLGKFGSLLLFAALGGIAVALLYDDVAPKASLDLKYSEAEIKGKARAYLLALGYDLKEYQQDASLFFDGSSQLFLQTHYGMKRANEILRADTLATHNWSVTWYDRSVPQSQARESFSVTLSPAGRILGFEHSIKDSLPMKSLGDADARALAEKFLTRQGIRLSMQTTALLAGFELLIMLALAITFLIHPGPGSDYLAPLRPSLSPHQFQGIIAGTVLDVLSLSGFEGPVPLAQESRRAAKHVGQAVIFSLIAIGLFYIFTSYASAIGWGTGNMAAFASNPNPFYDLGHALWGAGWWFVVLALINSSIAVGLACTNSASRVMYTMGRAGTLPARFGKIHPVHQTPSFAIAFQQLFGIGAVLLVGLLLRPEYIFGFLETISALAVIVLYSMANLALTSYVRRAHMESFSIWRHVIFPWAGTLTFAPVLFVTVYPVPSWPYNLAPYLYLAAMLVGFGYLRWLEASNPDALRRGATMLVGSRRTAEGEVDWDSP